MSLDKIRTTFQNFSTCKNWSLQLLNIKTSKKNGTGYNSREITLSPDNRLSSLLKDISDVYLGNGKKSLDLCQEVRTYDGTADARVIYSMDVDNALISSEYDSFLETIANPNTENDPFEYTSAYLLKGQVIVDEEEIPVKLVSMQNPTTTLKHKFLCNKGKFEEVKEKLLSLRPTLDILIASDTVYFLTLAGENLFNMARSYKIVCNQKVVEIEALDIIEAIDDFKAVVTSGHNPRRFVSYDENKLAALKREATRISIARQFDIPYNASNGKFDASADGTSVKIVKFLCNKGMLDPIEKSAVEVDGARKWS